jgi:hypothetical protein
MRAKNKSTRRICIGDTEIEKVQHFKYLGSYISTDSNIKKISTRIGLAAQAFDRLQNIWNETSWLAQDRDGWKRFVGALCSTWSEED